MNVPPSSPTDTAHERSSTVLVASLIFIALVVATIGSLGAPLITSVAVDYGVSAATAQWTLTITLLTGAVATPLLGRVGTDHRRRTIVLVTLTIVALGSAATVVPAPFAVLLAGRAAQGVGLGLTALMIATARQHLGDRAPSAIAMLSVASTVGIGVGYPIASLLVQFSGVRAAYFLGVRRSIDRSVRRTPPSPFVCTGREGVGGLDRSTTSVGWLDRGLAGGQSG